MIIEEIVFSNIATKQFVLYFNRENNTSIEVFTEIKEGISFAKINFGKTKINLSLKFMYRLGELQEGLRNERELLLPIKKYPLD